DPVLIRGNLATGAAIADIKLTGTGLHPELQGTVRLENVEATLPFSRLEVSQGFLYFDPSDSMNPRLELRGTSVIRDYTVRVYVYGTMLAPEAIFTSEPPLPQEEIISLIATGVTRQELSGRGNVLAGRAAMLLVQQLYRKVFKKGEPTQSNEFFNRLDLDVGAVDPRTGRQQVSARFKISDQFVLVGDVGVGGDDLAFFLEVFYRKHGYADVNVHYTIESENRLRLDITEGPRYTLRTIVFDGNVREPSDRLFEYAVGPTRERYSRTEKKLPFVA